MIPPLVLKTLQPTVADVAIEAPSKVTVIVSPAWKPEPVIEIAVPTGPEAGDTTIDGDTSVKLFVPVLPAVSAASRE